MCVTGPELWNTAPREPSGCGHPVPVSPPTLGVRAVDRRLKVWMKYVRKILPGRAGERATPAERDRPGTQGRFAALSEFSRSFLTSSYIR